MALKPLLDPTSDFVLGFSGALTIFPVRLVLGQGLGDDGLGSGLSSPLFTGR